MVILLFDNSNFSKLFNLPISGEILVILLVAKSSIFKLRNFPTSGGIIDT